MRVLRELVHRLAHVAGLNLIRFGTHGITCRGCGEHTPYEEVL